MFTDKYYKDICFIVGIPLLMKFSISFLKNHLFQNENTILKSTYACIELGGSSIKLGVGLKEYCKNTKKQSCRLIAGKNIQINTETPEQNLQQIEDFFMNEKIDYIGIASFGPICLDQSSDQYGYITTTPKIAWQNFPILQRVSEVIRYNSKNSIGFDTDVNSAAIAEFHFGGHDTKKSLAYITIGTGVGVGLIIDGQCVHGLTHPEGGHILVKLKEGDEYQGYCKKHQTCVEGMVSNFALAQRLNIQENQLKNVDHKHEVWDYTAYYIAQLCLNLTLICSPEVIVLGGGIMHKQGLLDKVHNQFIQILACYIQNEKLNNNIHKYIVRPFFENSGLIGTMVI